MMLYHATLESFEVGRTYTANEITPYYRQNELNGRAWVDDLLNQNKPENAPERQTTFFACDCIENCYAYISSRYPDRKAEYKFYCVEMQNPVRGVMTLTELVCRLGVNHNRLNEVIQEYWNPTKGWKYFEYLSNKMTIIEKLEIKKEQILFAKIKYQDDFDLYKKWEIILRES